jgi:hypothetical protein
VVTQVIGEILDDLGADRVGLIGQWLSYTSAFQDLERID